MREFILRDWQKCQRGVFRSMFVTQAAFKRKQRVCKEDNKTALTKHMYAPKFKSTSGPV